MGGQVEQAIQGEYLEHIAVGAVGRTRAFIFAYVKIVEAFHFHFAVFINMFYHRDIPGQPVCPGAGWCIGVFHDDSQAFCSGGNGPDVQRRADVGAIAGVLGRDDAMVMEYGTGDLQLGAKGGKGLLFELGFIFSVHDPAIFRVKEYGILSEISGTSKER